MYSRRGELLRHLPLDIERLDSCTSIIIPLANRTMYSIRDWDRKNSLLVFATTLGASESTTIRILYQLAALMALELGVTSTG